MPNLKPEIRALLARNASEESVERIDSEFESLCVELVSDWLSGEQRFESTSQQTEYWLSRLYETIYKDEQPESTRIYQRFRFPLSKAQYISRLLIARSAGDWRNVARTELKQTLEASRALAEDAIRSGRGVVEDYSISLSRGAYDELIVIYDDVCRRLRSAQRPPAVRKQSSTSSFVACTIMASTVIAILKELA